MVDDDGTIVEIASRSRKNVNLLKRHISGGLLLYSFSPMPLNRVRPSWLLSCGILLLCVAPVATFGLLQALLSSDVGNASTKALLGVCAALFMLSGLALVVLGAYRMQLGSRRIATLIAVGELLLALHYLAWKRRIIVDFSGGTVLWLLVLVPLAVVGLITLVRNAIRKEHPLWTAGGIALWAAQVAAIGYLYRLLEGV